MSIKKVDPSTSAPALEEIKDASHAGGRDDWVLNLPHLLTEAGFQDAKIHFYDDPPDLARAFNDQHLSTMEFATKLASQGQMEAASRFAHLVQAGYQEGVNGAALCFPRVVVVARRPV